MTLNNNSVCSCMLSDAEGAKNRQLTGKLYLHADVILYYKTARTIDCIMCQV